MAQGLLNALTYIGGNKSSSTSLWQCQYEKIHAAVDRLSILQVLMEYIFTDFSRSVRLVFLQVSLTTLPLRMQ